MCSGAILLYGIPSVVVGENRNFKGEEALLRSRGVAVEVLQDPSCIALMQKFIAAHPELWDEDIGQPSEVRPSTGAGVRVEPSAKARQASREESASFRRSGS